MKDTTARAFQISLMTDDQINKLHEIEKKAGYILPNWNIQVLFGMRSIADSYTIAPENMGRHIQRVENEIAQLKLEKQVEYGGGWLDFMHSFDWVINANKSSIVWKFKDYRKAGGLMSRLKTGIENAIPDND
jgi:hypothetical protein